jgi:hypothetical protein
MVARELPVGSLDARIRQWARGRSFVTYQAHADKDLEIVVETIPWHQVVCSEWKIIAEIKMKDDVSVDQRIVSMGACL